jgi:hypothetical protein
MFSSTQNIDQPISPAAGTATLEAGQSTLYADVGWNMRGELPLNDLQHIACQLVLRALDQYTLQNDPEAWQPHLQYTGGEGGTGKSRVVEAIQKVFMARNEPDGIIVSATSGSAAVGINGVTVHSALGLCVRRKGSDNLEADNTVSGRMAQNSTRAWRLQTAKVFIVDEVSMLGGITLNDINEQLKHARRDARPFGGMPVVLFTGDFYQFGPVLQRSILLPGRIRGARVGGEERHQQGHELWLQFKHVVILEEQVRASGDPQLLALLTKLRKFEQDETDLAVLNSRVLDRSSIPYDDELRVITPLNRHRWDLASQAVLAWAVEKGKPVSIFLSGHKWDYKPSEEEMTRAFEQGDDIECPIPSILYFAPGMPVIVNENTYFGLKVVNGGRFEAPAIVPDPAFPGHHVPNTNVTLHYGPPTGIILKSKSTAGLQVPGLPNGTVFLGRKNHTMRAKESVGGLKVKCVRSGLPCTPGIVMTDFKSQGGTMAKVVLGLYGRRYNEAGEISACDFTTAYVQLSRARSLSSISFLREIRREDFLGLRLDEEMVRAVERLKRLSAQTVAGYRANYMDS